MSHTIGQILKNAREQTPLSAEDIADQLRIDKAIILNIESDAYPSDSITLFIKGYIRGYARLVNLPTEEIDALLVEMGASKGQRIKPTHVFNFEDQPQKHHTHLLKWGSLAVVLVLAILVITWAYTEHYSLDSIPKLTTTLPTDSTTTTTNPPTQPNATATTTTNTSNNPQTNTQPVTIPPPPVTSR